MAETQTIEVLTREDIENLRFVQNVSGGQLIIPDLGKNGATFEKDEVVDLTRFFSKKDLGQSRNLDWTLRNKKLITLKYDEERKEIIGAQEPTKTRGDGLPKNVAVEDTRTTTFDKGLDDIEDKEHQDDLDTRVGQKRRTRADVKED